MSFNSYQIEYIDYKIITFLLKIWMIMVQMMRHAEKLHNELMNMGACETEKIMLEDSMLLHKKLYWFAKRNNLPKLRYNFKICNDFDNDRMEMIALINKFTNCTQNMITWTCPWWHIHCQGVPKCTPFTEIMKVHLKSLTNIINEAYEWTIKILNDCNIYTDMIETIISNCRMMLLAWTENLWKKSVNMKFHFLCLTAHVHVNKVFHKQHSAVLCTTEFKQSWRRVTWQSCIPSCN